MKRIIMFVSIFLAIFAAYIAAHFEIYFSVVNFFGVTSHRDIISLTETLVFLGGSFFLATFLSHFKDNVFTRVYYFLAASWLGILTNLFMFFALGWLAVWVSNKLNIAPNEFLIGNLAVGATLLFSVYGAWNAFTPRIKRITISLENLPDVWKGKKIVLISDVHLGNIFTERYAYDLVVKINKLHPDAVLISGDLFDGTEERLDTFIAPLNKFKAPLGVYYATGNHETYLEENIDYIISKTEINWLRDEMKDVGGLQIIGIEYPERAQHKDVAKVIESLQDFDPQKPSILLWHTPTQIESIKKAGISLLLSGHTHKGQLFPFGLITKVVYGGYDYGFKREGKFAIYTSSGLGGWGPPMRTQKTSELVQITLR